MSELKPCPFCGCEAELISWFDVDLLFAIQCKKCQARSDSWDKARKENAVTEWNTRTDSVKAQMLEALEKSIRKHYSCEDDWYSCPKSEYGCANDVAGDDCNCGADEWNNYVDKIIKAVDKEEV